MITLKGHAAFITGSTSGVGRAIAEAFAAAGADVVLHGLAAGADAEEAVAACAGHGVKASFFPADFTEPIGPTIERVGRELLERCPRPTILVNNAGQYFDRPFPEMTVERFERTMRLNVAMPYFLTQWFANHWIREGTGGRVLMIGSINGRLAEPGSTAYDTSKGAVEMMVRTLAVSLAPLGIRVNGLAPGIVESAQTRFLHQRPDELAWRRHHTPNGQFPPADVCGGAAVFLCSDAASHVHGHMMLVDGGLGAIQYPVRAGYSRPTETP